MSKDSKVTVDGYKVVSFYTTHNAYKKYAERLRRSLLKFDIPHELHAIELKTAWEGICAYKASFLREKWKESSVPIVWLDADATVEQNPEFFSATDTDFAIHKWKEWRFGTGTIYFGKSEETGLLLDQWVLRCKADPVTWDQVHLQSAWCDISAKGFLRTTWLPQSYLQIFDAQQDEPPVIKHWQASRDEKKEEFLDHTPYGIALRKSNKPWRNQEEAFWIDEGTEHIIPNTGHAFPEGDHVDGALRRCVDGKWPLLEIGCGIGRIASLFKPQEYIGVDINPRAIISARKNLPQHTFRIADSGYELPAATTVLLYTVLLHIADESFSLFLSECIRNHERLIIAEVMDRRWRRGGNPPVFNRDPEEYIFAMQQLGFYLTKSEKQVYKRYDMEPWNIGRDSRITFLVFERRTKL